MSIEKMRSFLGWCTVINFALYFVGVIQHLLIGEWASEVHADMFQIDAVSVRQAYFLYLVYYKLAIVVFNLVPYVALRIMSRGKNYNQNGGLDHELTREG